MNPAHALQAPFVPRAADLLGAPDRPEHGLLLVVLLMVLSIACVTDLRERRIPNWLTFSAAIVAVILHGLHGGAVASLLAYLGFLLAGFVLYSTVLARGVGAGDIKLLAACAAFLGWMPALYLALFSFAAHVGWMIVSWFLAGVAQKNLIALVRWLALLLLPRSVRVPFVPHGAEERSPHAPFVLLGAALLYTLWARGEVVP
ncbi:MAG: A24 family peptidase [Polyangia bacterium]